MKSTRELNVHIIASVEPQTKQFTHKTYMNQYLEMALWFTNTSTSWVLQIQSSLMQ
jgi:hypothetical protein